MRRNCSPEVEITSVRLHTDREGLGMVLGPLELAIMRALWDETGQRPATNKELRHLLQCAGMELALSTVGNTLHRLTRKGYVVEAVSAEKLYVYVPSCTEEELELWLVGHVMGRLLQHWPAYFEELGIINDKHCTQHNTTSHVESSRSRL